MYTFIPRFFVLKMADHHHLRYFLDITQWYLVFEVFCCCFVSVIYSCKWFLHAGQDKSCTKLQKWSKDIVNHFWYACKTANSMDEFMVCIMYLKKSFNVKTQRIILIHLVNAFNILRLFCK